ncbi:MAG: hypothetical protein GVY21_00810 [Gammaproteobacteria bacterium]|jgi:hypothetical protein|nr:hypothetical protein [Gammaproteobacteria bacterium]
MQVVTRTDEYTIYKKRNQRYAVRNKDRQWVRGDDKVAVLLAHNLIEAPTPKAPEQPEEPEAAEAATGEAAEGASAEGEEAGEQGESEGEEKS